MEHKHFSLYISYILITVDQFGDPWPGTQQPGRDRRVQDALDGSSGRLDPYRHRYTLNRIQIIFREEHHSFSRPRIELLFVLRDLTSYTTPSGHR